MRDVFMAKVCTKFRIKDNAYIINILVMSIALLIYPRSLYQKLFLASEMLN